MRLRGRFALAQVPTHINYWCAIVSGMHNGMVVCSGCVGNGLVVGVWCLVSDFFFRLATVSNAGHTTALLPQKTRWKQ